MLDAEIDREPLFPRQAIVEIDASGALRLANGLGPDQVEIDRLPADSRVHEDRAGDHVEALDRLPRQRNLDSAVADRAELLEDQSRIQIEIGLADIERADHQPHRAEGVTDTKVA